MGGGGGCKNNPCEIGAILMKCVREVKRRLKSSAKKGGFWKKILALVVKSSLSAKTLGSEDKKIAPSRNIPRSLRGQQPEPGDQEEK